MNIAVLIPIWKRHDLTDICFEHLSKQREKFGFDVMVVGSEGIDSKILTEKFGFEYAEFSNEKLGAKLNHGLSFLREYDGVVVLGSDDFITDNTWLDYYTLDLTCNVYYGFERLYFHTTKDRRTTDFYYAGTNMKTVGAGRIYSRKALESVNYILWSNDKNSGLDSDASARLFKNDCAELVIHGVRLMDVKHAQNITSHAVARLGKFVDPKLVHSKFGDCFNSILNLDFISGSECIKKKLL